MPDSNEERINPESLIIIQKHGFLAVVWTCFALCTAFLAFRVYVRLYVFGRFLVDDAFVFLAWLISLICAILWYVQKTLDMEYMSWLVGFGIEEPSEYFIAHQTNFLHLLYAELILSMLALWSIKASFLVLFWKLTKDVHFERIMWWVVTALTIILLAISIGVAPYRCIFGSSEDRNSWCPTAAAGKAIYRDYRIQFACDFVSDFLILAIPTKLIWKVQMGLRQKLAIVGVFSLVGITMVFSLVRIIVGLRGVREDDVWMFLCSTIELTVAIIVACLVSYRSLYKSRRQASALSYTKWISNVSRSNDMPKKYKPPELSNDGHTTAVTSVSDLESQNLDLQRGSSETPLASGPNGGIDGGGQETIPLDIIGSEHHIDAVHTRHPRYR